jgi:hypothetical protein
VIQQIEVVMKKLRYVGFIIDNKAYLCKYKQNKPMDIMKRPQPATAGGGPILIIKRSLV